MKKPSVYLLFLVSWVAALNTIAQPKNIILFIGDGMGVSQLTAAKYTKGTLEIERLPVGGLLTTYSASSFTTDSAAAGTAMATGQKTSNSTIAQTPEGKRLKTSLEVAKERGKATGLVCTSSITHATPASFSAHVSSRGMQQKIAEQIAEQKIDVLFGGGLGFFLPQSVKGSLRKDDKNVLMSLKAWSPVITTEEEFNALETPKRIAGFFATNELVKVSEGRIGLDAMTSKAIEILSQNDAGFFLVVEGSQIDWACHDNDADRAVREVMDFDAAVGVGVDFAMENDDTLVIVLADHETGGLSLLNGSIADKTVTKTVFSTKEHSSAMVPVFAYGSGAEVFGGIKDNTYIGKQIIKYLECDSTTPGSL